jgi:hypothetical protein
MKNMDDEKGTENSKVWNFRSRSIAL